MDLKGEGLASRAVIRRGAITGVQKQTLAGLDLRFFWDDGKPITDLEVWRNGQKLQVKEKLVIPYGQSHANIKLIAVKDGFAEAVNLSVPAENYELRVSHFYNE